MKKVFSALLCLALVFITVSACTKKDDDFNYVITLSCENDGYEWIYEAEREGIVAVSQSKTPRDDFITDYIFLLESVGEGETKITFSLVEGENKNLKETVIYLIKVDGDYKITAELMERKKEEVTEGICVSGEDDAQKLVEETVTQENPEYEGRLFFETKKKGDIYIVRVFVLSSDENGKTVLKYMITYEVDGDGNMKSYVEQSVENIPYIVK